MCITAQDNGGKVQTINMFGRYPQRNLLVTESYENDEGEDGDEEEESGKRSGKAKTVRMLA
jgi:hypothetical protein